jgi:hypothetical protein
MVDDKVLKGRIARVIAATRFPFVGQDDWDETRTTIANDYRNKQWAFETPDGPLYPSVAVLNADGTIRECGLVETSTEFNGEDVKKWKTLSEMTGMGITYKKFFLYVPEGSEEKAEKLLDDNAVQYAGLRTWSLDNWNLVLKPYKTPDMAKDHR